MMINDSMNPMMMMNQIEKNLDVHVDYQPFLWFERKKKCFENPTDRRENTPNKQNTRRGGRGKDNFLLLDFLYDPIW